MQTWLEIVRENNNRGRAITGEELSAFSGLRPEHRKNYIRLIDGNFK